MRRRPNPSLPLRTPNSGQGVPGEEGFGGFVGDEEEGGSRGGSDEGGADAPVDSREAAGCEEAGGGLEAGFEGVEGEEG